MKLLITLTGILLLPLLTNAQVLEKEELNGVCLNYELDSIKLIPNPYYAYSNWECQKKKCDYSPCYHRTRMKVTHLPTGTTIDIFNVNGDLIRKLNNKNENEIFWDLKNENEIPITGGLYLFHIKTASGEERIMKWWVVMNYDCNSF